VIIDFSIPLSCGSVVLYIEDAGAAAAVVCCWGSYLLPFELAMLGGITIGGLKTVAWLPPVSVVKASAA
jgi:hypothetical protein